MHIFSIKMSIVLVWILNFVLNLIIKNKKVEFHQTKTLTYETSTVNHKKAIQNGRKYVQTIYLSSTRCAILGLVVNIHKELLQLKIEQQ